MALKRFETQDGVKIEVSDGIVDENGDPIFGSGVVERSISFPMGATGDTRGTIALTPDDATYICTADYENLTPQYQGNYSVVNSEAYDINQSGGVYNMITVDATGNTDLLFIISNGSYANSDWTIDAGVAYGGVQTCDLVQTNGNLIYFSWPHRTGVDPTTIAQDDPATVTYNGTITQQPIWTKLINISQGGFDNEGDGQISWRSDGDLTIETLRPTGYTGDCDLNLYAADDVFIEARGDDVGISAFNVVNINTDDGSHTWRFNENGNLTLPNGGDILDSNGVSVLSGLDANIWVQTFVSDAPTEDFPQIATSVEYDSDGNVIALFSHFDTGGVENSRYYSVGKYTATGTKIWTARFAADLNTDGWGLAVDNADGWIYVAGQTGGDVYTYDVSTLTKIDSSDGSVAWSKIYDFGFASSSAVVDVDSAGHPIMVGYADNADNEGYLTVTKINKLNGNVTWTRKLDGQTNEQAYGMAVGPAGEIVAVGTVDNLNYPEPYRTIVTLTATPASDPDWTTDILGATQGGLTYDVTFAGGVPTFSNIVDTDGNRYEGDLLVTFNASQLGSGSTNMEVRVGTTTGEDMSDRMVVVKYASDGTIAWQKAIQFDADYNCSGADADIDSNGNIYICGQFNIDGGGGDTGIALVKFNSSGVKQWSRRVVGNCISTATSIVVGPDDKLYISGVNGDDVDSTFTWVVAKYSLDGLVEWQRFIENTDSWTFAGTLFGPEGGGSNIAVRQGYVALAGGFGSFDQQSYAAVLQISDTGNVFAVGPWSVTAANLSGTLNGTASDIGVVNADLTDSDNVLTVEPDSVTIGTEVGAFLIGTVYTAPGGDNSLVNGVHSVVLGNTGTVTLPAGGTITEGYVTSNPTIQLTPASPDVASQKLVIKGGGAYTYTDNGISINYNNNTAIVGDTLTFYVNSNTYADQTLYWWIHPSGANISDPGSGTVALNEFGYGSFSFDLDSDDNEFTVRVSPEDNNYDPASLGVETGLINPDAPTFDSEHHLHLTTGNLAETSIFLGTDDHNVRTTVNGGIEINTFLYPSGGGSGKWTFSENGDLTFPDDTVQTTAYIPGDIQSENDISVRINLTDSTQRVWRFGEDGDLTFPDATVQTTASIQGEQIFTLDTGAIDYAPTTVDFNLLFVTPAIGYSGTDPTSVTLPAGVPGQRLVIFNGYNLATLTVNPGLLGRDISSGVVAEFIYSGFDGLWIPLYGTNSPT